MKVSFLLIFRLILLLMIRDCFNNRRRKSYIGVGWEVQVGKKTEKKNYAILRESRASMRKRWNHAVSRFYCLSSSRQDEFVNFIHQKIISRVFVVSAVLTGGWNGIYDNFYNTQENILVSEDFFRFVLYGEKWEVSIFSSLLLSVCE